MRHFKLQDFDSPDLPGSGINMNSWFLQLLDSCRDEAGIPFHINSGFRTPQHNASVGGVSTSAHLKGLAADIRAFTAKEKFLILDAAFKNHIKRIGIGSNFIHLDVDLSLPFPSVWVYNNK